MPSTEVRSRPVTVVVLARNAETTIGRTVRSIGAQQVFRPGSPYALSVLVVVNGTTDRTAEVARTAWDALGHAVATDAVLHVHELDAPGKANAWNSAVHRLTAATPDAFIFCDSDIELDEPDTFRLLLEALDERPSVTVATPEPRKSLRGVRSRAVRTLATRGLGGEYSPDAIAGGCYAIRGGFARLMELPRTITIDDGFLHAMVLTEQFTATPDPTKVVRVPGASFVFDAEPTLRSLIDHERRLTIGGTYNAYAFRELHAVCGPDVPAGPLLAERNREHPGWIDELVLADKRRGRRWFVPNTYLTRRLHRDRSRPTAIAAGAVVAGVAADVMVSLWANDYFRTFESSPVW
jgi:glycosyltransferase involved in cell wall biosynthesis